jgi:hypothetical protein
MPSTAGFADQVAVAGVRVLGSVLRAFDATFMAWQTGGTPPEQPQVNARYGETNAQW